MHSTKFSAASISIFCVSVSMPSRPCSPNLAGHAGGGKTPNRDPRQPRQDAGLHGGACGKTPTDFAGRLAAAVLARGQVRNSGELAYAAEPKPLLWVNNCRCCHCLVAVNDPASVPEYGGLLMKLVIATV